MSEHRHHSLALSPEKIYTEKYFAAVDIFLCIYLFVQYLLHIQKFETFF